MMGKSKKIQCPDVMDISGVAEFYAQLREVKNGSTVTFKAAEIERIDTSSLQLLAAFVLDAASRNISVKWDHPSDVLIDSAQLLGLQDSLHFVAS